MAKEEAAIIYYGLQYLTTHKDLGADKLFTVRAACIPPEDWTYDIWQEAARVVGTHSKIIMVATGDNPALCALVQEMFGQSPNEQGRFDARVSTPRPSEEQIDTVRELAKQLKAQAPPPVRFDVILTPDLGFARINIPPSMNLYRTVQKLPGYIVIENKAQVWLSQELADFITTYELTPDPAVLPAITAEIIRIQTEHEWALALERASSCAHPKDYPPKLIAALREMQPRGITFHAA